MYFKQKTCNLILKQLRVIDIIFLKTNVPIFAVNIIVLYNSSCNSKKIKGIHYDKNALL